MLKLDESAIDKMFTDNLDILWPGAMLMASCDSGKVIPSHFGLSMIFTNKLLRQENHKDLIAVLVQQLTRKLSIGIAELRSSVGRDFVVDPLKFKYTEGVFNPELSNETGTTVIVTVPIKEKKTSKNKYNIV